jgi:hypothetical protein
VPEVVQTCEGGTSRLMRTEYPQWEEFLRGDSLWTDGSFAETEGCVDEGVCGDTEENTVSDCAGSYPEARNPGR